MKQVEIGSTCSTHGRLILCYFTYTLLLLIIKANKMHCFSTLFW